MHIRSCQRIKKQIQSQQNDLYMSNISSTRSSVVSTMATSQTRAPPSSDLSNCGLTHTYPNRYRRMIRCRSFDLDDICCQPEAPSPLKTRGEWDNQVFSTRSLEKHFPLINKNYQKGLRYNLSCYTYLFCVGFTKFVSLET